MSRKRKPAQIRVNRRTVFSEKRTILAEYGWYTTPVQHVVKRSRWKVREDLLQKYFMDVAVALRDRSQHLAVAACSHWPVVFELGLALNKVLCERKNPAYWLLTLPVNVAVNRELETWGELSARIVKNGGPDFDTRTLRKTAERLKIT